MKPVSVGSAVRALLALAAVTAAGRGLPAFAQDVPAASTPGVVSVGADGLEEVVVEGRQRTAAEQVLQERIELPVVADVVSADQISRVGDSTVSLALRRLPAVTVVDGQYIYIRGLGERYSSTTLNGAQVPSPDLTRNVIPLDLFPAAIVDSLKVQKGYSPDKPAAFGGGNVDVRTRGLPDRFVADVEIGTGWNSDSDGSGYTYPGGSDDRWGTDDGTRALPRGITTAISDYTGDITPTGILRALNRDGGFHTLAEAEQINREIATNLNRNLDLRKESLDPDINVEAALGNMWQAGESGDWRIGGLAVVDYGDQWRNRDRINRSATSPEVDFDKTERTIRQTTLTGSLAVGLDWAGEQQLQASWLYLRNTEDEASLTIGNNFNFQANAGSQLRNYRIRFEERELEVLQLSGRHRLGTGTLGLLDVVPGVGNLEDLAFDWYYTDAVANTDIPNEVQFSAVDRLDPDTGEFLSTSIRSSATAADYRYTELEDDVTSYGMKLEMPIEAGDFLVVPGGGYDYYEKGRGYLQTQFGLGTTASAALPNLVGTPGQVFTDENITNPANGYVLSLGGIGTESYLAGETIDAVWGNVDVTWDETWRLSAGARWEDFARVSVPIDQYEYDPGVGIIRVPLENIQDQAVAEDDYYPAAAVTWMPGELWAQQFQLRFGWSETTARPDLREISDATFIDPLTEARVRGNPDLVSSDLMNLDLRGEWFFGSGDNLTVSLFYKDITNPIETVEAPGSDDNIGLTFINAASADVYGVEVEWLKGLGFLPLGRWSDAFFVSGNVTVSDSNLTVGGNALNLTNDERRLTQHAPWVINLQLGFDAPNERHSASLAYNAFDERVFFAGSNGAPDAYEQPFHSLDIVYSYYPLEQMSLRFRVQNLLDEQLEIEQGGVTVLEQTVGTSFKVDLAYRF
jgi:TonB-dependent receptor